MLIKKKYLITITICGLFIRLVGFDFISNDMRFCLLPWFGLINSNGGFNALAEQVGDYGLLYQTIIALMTYIDISPVYLYKTISVIFDFLLAISITYFLNSCSLTTELPSKHQIWKEHVIFASVLFLPTIVLNSSFWGQCDSIYTCFLLWSIWFLYKKKFKSSFFMLGCALSFKLQTVLLFPLFFLYYFLESGFSLSLNLLIMTVTFWISGSVAYLYGRNLLDGINIYLYQIGEYKKMWLNVPSFWALTGVNNYDEVHIYAIVLTFLIIGVGFCKMILQKWDINSFDRLMSVAVFIEWTCIIFLPSMHERYTYVMDVLLLMLSILDGRYSKYAVIAIGTSCITYCSFLFRTPELNAWLIAIYVVTWCCFLGEMFGITAVVEKYL